MNLLIRALKKFEKIIEYYTINFFLKTKFLFNPGKPVWVGNSYGGFFVNLELLTDKSIVYSFGIGLDISFDNDLIKRKQVTIFGFDPTPKSIAWAKKLEVPKFNFYEYGLGTEDGIFELYLPKNKDYVSGSIVKHKALSGKATLIELKTLKTIMKELSHSKIDLLKMDVEGIEYEIIENMLSERIHVNQLVVEFHDRFIENGVKRRKEVINKLKDNGYELFAISKTLLEYTFVKT